MPAQDQPAYSLAEVYTDLRNAIFALEPGKHAMTPERSPSGVWGVIVDLGMAAGIATLVVLTEGTVSMYFSGGGGGMGFGNLDRPRQAADALLKAAPLYAGAFEPTDTHPLPAPERVRFYLLTFSGVLTAEAGAQEMSDPQHPLGVLFVLAQNLLTEMLSAQEQLNAQQEQTPQS